MGEIKKSKVGTELEGNNEMTEGCIKRADEEMHLKEEEE